ncbi:peptidoglycan editing factor PgeF [Phycicoccus sp. Soil802]|uniref:peptidoglycan editing factor PgeF n=1 Tax=Phycicoccus sp. Soil802 TaxID=1736414 RepID=UPI0007033566|nr:peptidoglycan editing factor PgeF [Phycicoccus sp. Soil802]KRF29555.1 laccase [Phycicoccus sp. Soil802]
MFYWRQQTSRVSWAFTDRAGGSSSGDFDSLNLGGHVGDDAAAVEANREAVAGATGVGRDHLLFLQQCHGADVVVADGPWDAGGPPPADGVVTATAGLALAVLVADCTPVLLADVDTGVVGAVHAGRPGMTAGIVEVAVERMRELGARDLRAVVGPSICARCYEVPEELRAAAAAVAPEASARSWSGTPAIDVAAGVVAQLVANNVAVQWVPGCAREDERLFSYRRDGRTGRYAGVVVAGAP